MPRDLSPRQPPTLAVAENATTPVGKLGAEIWSTTANKKLVWTGTNWADAMGSGGSPTTDPIDLVDQPSITPPPANTVRVFGRNVSGRMLPAFVGPSGLDSSLQPFLARNKIGLFIPPGNATTVQTLGMNVTATGTATAANVAATNVHTAMRRLEYAVTTASTTAIAGVRSGVAQHYLGNSSTPFGGFHFVTRFGPSRGSASNSTRRFFVGMTSITAAPTDVNPSTWAANAIGVGTDSTDLNFQIMHRNGTGAMTKIDTGIPKAYADNTAMFEVAIFKSPTTTNEVHVQFVRLSDNLTFRSTITTNLPAADTLLNWQIWTSVGGTSSVVGVSVASIYIETDY